MPPRKKKQNQHQYGQEMLAVFFLFSALFLLLSLTSYARPLVADAQPHMQHPADNWCGTFGYYVAYSLFSFLGLTAFFPVFLLLYLGVVSLFPGSVVRRLPLVMAGITGLLIASSGLLAQAREIVFSPRFLSPGGYLGALVQGLLGPVLGQIGSVLVLVLLLIFSLMAAVRFSPVTTMGYFLGRAKDVGETLGKRAVRPPVKKPAGNRQPVVAQVESSPAPVDAAPPARPLVHDPVPRDTPAMSEVVAEEFMLKPIAGGDFKLPPLSLLEKKESDQPPVDKEHFYQVSKILVAKLQDFGVHGTVEGISPGPVVTTYEFAPAAGVKINKIVGLSDDIAMALKVDRVRVVGSIPGKAALGIEIPNPVRRIVFLRDILLAREYRNADSLLSLALGFDVVGRPVIADLARMPHLLIAGATGAGKSVAINTFIASILFKATPEDVRLLMIDPKRIELSVYEGIPHLLHPVVVEPKMASRALLWAVREMERRYRLLEEHRVKSFDSYNQVAEEKLPYVVIIVDELADLMMVASKDVETSIARLAQMARAAGMHIILATQRPSVDVLTGLIKANFPTRISFKVSSKVDSRTILDGSGAEHLLGMGDMLFLPPGAAKLQRIHGAYISEGETEKLIAYLKEQGGAEYDESVMQVVEESTEGDDDREKEYDAKYDEAVAIVTETGQASISMVQRRLRVGYNRAARMIEMMEKEGIVGPADGSRPREVLVRGGYEA
ncbi:MAG TPA: DNA translocase FtsK [Desulfobulbaceae bacterium]|nr:DNA translocase FtsK [Desulfobulbaceae bacterium]